MAIKVGINGFGRIGRNLYRAAMGDKDIDIVAVNDITDPETLAHLLKYDSVLGNLKAEVSHGEDNIKVDGTHIKVFKERDPAKIDWPSMGISVVVESTGLFTNADDARKHWQKPGTGQNAAIKVEPVSCDRNKSHNPGRENEEQRGKVSVPPQQNG